jgi:hypothetical protein
MSSITNFDSRLCILAFQQIGHSIETPFEFFWKQYFTVVLNPQETAVMCSKPVMINNYTTSFRKYKIILSFPAKK